jgi:hypothetical protein
MVTINFQECLVHISQHYRRVVRITLISALLGSTQLCYDRAGVPLVAVAPVSLTNRCALTVVV